MFVELNWCFLYLRSLPMLMINDKVTRSMKECMLTCACLCV
jgi:hypothetical protein